MDKRIIVSMNRDTPPCKDCTNRSIGCHDRCCDYHEWKTAGDRARKARQQYDSLPPIKFE